MARTPEARFRRRAVLLAAPQLLVFRVHLFRHFPAAGGVPLFDVFVPNRLGVDVLFDDQLGKHAVRQVVLEGRSLLDLNLG